MQPYRNPAGQRMIATCLILCHSILFTSLTSLLDQLVLQSLVTRFDFVLSISYLHVAHSSIHTSDPTAQFFAILSIGTSDGDRVLAM